MIVPSELTGQFGGFVFNEAGKRRMLLRRTDAHDHLLKVPRILRRRIIGKFRVGELIRVAVIEERHPDTGVTRQVVSRVLPESASAVAPTSPTKADAPTAVACVVRVCSKKNCWRKGGQELFAALERELAASGHTDRVEIRQVGCLDRCKQAPNVDLGRRAYTRCSPRDARAIVAQALGHTAGCPVALE